MCGVIGLELSEWWRFRFCFLPVVKSGKPRPVVMSGE